MSVTTVITVDKCRDCPHVTNSAREHDCAFTAAPHPVYWYCTLGARMSLSGIDRIDPRCPLKEEIER
jgi:hypothetical protein